MRTIYLLIFALGFSACSGSNKARTEEPVVPEEPVETIEPIDLSQYEDFDAAPYRESDEIATQVDIAHDVLAQLMNNRTGQPTTYTTDGYRIQVFSSQSKQQADQIWGEAVAWWRNLPTPDQPDGYNPDGLDAEVVYMQPYYRVRLGNFTSRAQAQQLLTLLRARFDRALIVPDRVTVQR
ncbi:MAG: SPOR domain-containing protein [Rhodothermales bacterium]